VTVLVDGNLLIALAVGDHVHHAVAEDWFAAESRAFATTPTTQGTLLRFLLRAGLDVRAAYSVLEMVRSHPRHVFAADDEPYDADRLRGVVGHRQVTDAYLAGQARSRGWRLATLDRGLAELHRDVTELLPIAPEPG
jgi:toxin-antitoxin system PIN domain toxin